MPKINNVTVRNLNTGAKVPTCRHSLVQVHGGFVPAVVEPGDEGIGRPPVVAAMVATAAGSKMHGGAGQ